MLHGQLSNAKHYAGGLRKRCEDLLLHVKLSTLKSAKPIIQNGKLRQPTSPNSPVEKPQNLAMSGNNRFCAFFSTPDHIIQESIGCNDYPRLAFSKFKMAAKMDAKSHYWL